MVQLRLFIIKVGEDDVEENLEIVDLLFCVLLDEGNVVHLSKVAADLVEIFFKMKFYVTRHNNICLRMS